MLPHVANAWHNAALLPWYSVSLCFALCGAAHGGTSQGVSCVAHCVCPNVCVTKQLVSPDPAGRHRADHGALQGLQEERACDGRHPAGQDAAARAAGQGLEEHRLLGLPARQDPQERDRRAVRSARGALRSMKQ